MCYYRFGIVVTTQIPTFHNCSHACHVTMSVHEQVKQNHYSTLDLSSSAVVAVVRS